MTTTFPLGPHFADPTERAVLARCLRRAHTMLLDPARPASRARWSRGYHARNMLGFLLHAEGQDELGVRVWLCPVWRGRDVTGREAQELATDGPIKA